MIQEETLEWQKFEEKKKEEWKVHVNEKNHKLFIKKIHRQRSSYWA